MGKFGGFSSVKLTKPQRSTFDLTHDRRLSVQAGELVPVLVTECVPSDTFSGSSEMLVRLAPLLAPIYDQVIVYVHYFFVPNRLIWEDWEEFITGGRLGVGVDPVTAPVPPFVSINGVWDPGVAWGKYSLADYLGMPILPQETESIVSYAYNVNVMPFYAYQLIWQNYYIDRNLNNTWADFFEPLNSGDQTSEAANFMVMRYRAYMKDYFTSALPFTQRGEEVMLPVELSGYAPVVGRSNDGSIDRWNVAATITPGGGGVTLELDADPDAPAGAAGVNDFGYANLNDVQDTGFSATINDFRAAYALQVWLERNAIGGSRYTESTQAHFGVRPQDSRLQRPEYIGGGRINVKISEVVSTAWSTDGDTNEYPLANMAGHGVSYGNTNRFKYFCTEHGFIMGILSIVSPPSYHQGMPRMFMRSSFLDYPWPTFAKLGEQEVHKAEIFANIANLTADVDTGELPLFGYQSRYADWKYIPNTNHADFHDTLLFWTTTRDFATASPPELNNSFIEYDPQSMNRIFASSDYSGYNFWVYCHNKLFVKRPLPYFGTPNTLGFS